MENSPIYTTEPMATRALAAEIRHDPSGLIRILSERCGVRSFGTLRRVRCEAEEQIDIELVFETGAAEPYLLGIEAKFDHELSREQIEREVEAMDRLVVLVANVDAVPGWLATEYPLVSIISWQETLASFTDSRITLNDLASIKLLKAAVEAKLNALEFEGLEGWTTSIARGGSGMPSVIFESPQLPCGRNLRGQLEVAGRGMPSAEDDVRFISHIGVSVPETVANYFDPNLSDEIPGWIEHLNTLQREVLEGHEDRLLISRRAPGTSKRKLGRWKTELAKKHLGNQAYLAKGYTDGWAIGPKTQAVSVDQLEELATVTAEIFGRWFDAETE